KDDLLAQALLVHVGSVMAAVPPMPPAGAGALAENLRLFIETGIEALTQVTPAFAGLLAQPGVIRRFHGMVGGDQALTGLTNESGEATVAGPGDNNPRSLPEIATAYLLDEQRIGRLDPAADVEAAAVMLVGALHGLVLPRVLFSSPGNTPVPLPGIAERLADTILRGIAASAEDRR